MKQVTKFISLFFAFISASNATQFELEKTDLYANRLSSDGFGNDQKIGITHFADPQTAESIGARGLKIWVEPHGANVRYYLRVAREKYQLENNNLPLDKFQGDTYEDALDWIINRMAWPSGAASFSPIYYYRSWPQHFAALTRRDSEISTVEDVLRRSYWDHMYSLASNGDNSSSANYATDRGLSRIREYLLEERFGINARFVHEQEGRRAIKEFVVEGTAGDDASSEAFIFDSDPFSTAYRKNQRSRVISQLTDHQFTTRYQWVKVEGGTASYGDIHTIVLPRPVNIAVMGDSFTSGEAAPNEGFYGTPNWITEYKGASAHRSVLSGWELAVNQTVKTWFTDRGFNFYNVSTTGAVARNIGEGGPRYEEAPSSPSAAKVIGSTVSLELKTAARQLLTLDQLLENDGQNTVDILGFTFGGNDAHFSKIIQTILFLPGGAWDVDDIGSPDLIYPVPDSKRPFHKAGDIPKVFSQPLGQPLISMDQMVATALNNLEWLGLSLREGGFGFEVKKVIRGNYPNPVGGAEIYKPLIGKIFGDVAVAVFDECVDNWLADYDPEYDCPWWANLVTLWGCELVAEIVELTVEVAWDVARYSGCTIAAGTAGALAEFFALGLFWIDPWEADKIRDEIMPRMNDNLVGVDARRFGYELADTRDILGYNHSHHISSFNPWFSGIETLIEDNEEFTYAFHPNEYGHRYVYKPVYLSSLQECLKSRHLDNIYKEENPSVDPDLEIIEATIAYDDQDSTLKLVLDVKNVGQQATKPSVANAIVFIDRPGGGLFPEDSFEVSVKDLSRQEVIIEPLAGGERKIRVYDLARGPEDCVYFDFLLRHFLSLQDEERVREIIGNVYPTDSVAARMAAWIPLFGGNHLSFRVSVSPADLSAERNMRNNYSRDMVVIPREDTGWEQALEWIRKNLAAFHKELGARAKDETGKDLEELTATDLIENQSLLELFGFINNQSPLRDNLKDGLNIPIGDLVNIAEEIREASDFGPLNPKLKFISDDAHYDKVTLITPSRSITVDAKDFNTIFDLIPCDGKPVKGVYHRAVPDEKDPFEKLFEEFEITIEAPHLHNGLVDYIGPNQSSESGEIEIGIDFAPDDKENPSSSNAWWRVRDPKTGANFIVSPSSKGDDSKTKVDLGRYLFSSPQAQIEISTVRNYGLITNGYNYLLPNNSTIEQQDAYVDGPFMCFDYTVTGDYAAVMDGGFEIIVKSDQSSELIYHTVPDSFLFSEGKEGESTMNFTLCVPLDFASSGMNIVWIVPNSDPKDLRITSIDYYNSLEYSQEGIDADYTAALIDLESTTKGKVFSEQGGLLVIDWSEDLRTWVRIETHFIEQNGSIEFDTPELAADKAFFRASIREYRNE